MQILASFFAFSAGLIQAQTVKLSSCAGQCNGTPSEWYLTNFPPAEWYHFVQIPWTRWIITVYAKVLSPSRVISYCAKTFRQQSDILLCKSLSERWEALQSDIFCAKVLSASKVISYCANKQSATRVLYSCAKTFSRVGVWKQNQATKSQESQTDYWGLCEILNKLCQGCRRFLTISDPRWDQPISDIFI